ncbi:MAG: CARDB domain-containing protein, partial [Limisphaerales bacterium]
MSLSWNRLCRAWSLCGAGLFWLGAVCGAADWVPRGAILTLHHIEGNEWQLPATVRIEVTGPPSAGFLGSNNKLETGSPVFSEAPRQQGATFYACNIVAGFPGTLVGNRPFPNRLGGSSFIAVKANPDGTRLVWINATMGAFRISGGFTSNWEYQVRYFSGDPANKIPESMVIGVVPNSGFFGGIPINLYDVELLTAEVRVRAVDCKYPGRPHFLDGVPFPVVWRATLDWAGTTPGKVLFMTPTSTNEVQADGEFAYHTIDMGAEFGPGGILRVAPVLPTGDTATEMEAPMEVMVSPLFGQDFLFSEATPSDTETRTPGRSSLSFTYATSDNILPTLLDFEIPAGRIPKWLPVFGTNPIVSQFLPEMAYSVTSEGAAELSFSWSSLIRSTRPDSPSSAKGALKTLEEKLKKDPKTVAKLIRQYKGNPEFLRSSLARLKGAERSFYLVPSIAGTRSYKDDADIWGEENFIFSIGAGYSVSFSRPFLSPTGVPMYWKLAGAFEGKASARVGISPWNWDVPVSANLSVRGSLGVGINELLGAEGWIQGALEAGWVYNTNKFSDPPGKMLVHLTTGATAYALLFKWDKEIGRITWDLNSPEDPSPQLASSSRVRGPLPIPRDYIDHPDSGRFFDGRRRVADGRPAPAALVPQTTPLELSVFPLSQPAVAANAQEAHLVWLRDDPDRSEFNRTRLMSSRFDGSNWTPPVPVGDDGTADFHPQIVVFPNGDALAAWSNQRIVHPGAATYETMLAGMDIALARFDGTAKRWFPAVSLSAGNYLNVAPKISGTSPDDCLVVWLANPANDPVGNAARPNELWSARWNAGAWSEPIRIAVVPLPVFRLAVIFNGTRGDLVCSVDQDADVSTVADREIHRATWENGQWSGLVRLTTDTVPDDNPSLLADTDGKPLLVWLRDGELCAAPDLDPTRRVVILKTEYSSNLADFRVASGPGGRAAILWAEPSEESSDVWAVLRDPTAGVWGEPKKLTDDPETERGLTAAFLGSDTLFAAYNRSLIGPPADGAALQAVQPVPLSDLFVLTYLPAADVGIEPESLNFLPDPARAGDEVFASVTVGNFGDQAVSDLPVALIRDGSVEIARVALEGVLRPGESRDVSFRWTLPDPVPGELAVVVDPEQRISEGNRGNNRVVIPLMVSDLKLQSLAWTQSPTDPNQFALDAWVVNNGTRVSAIGNLVVGDSAVGGASFVTNAIPPL